MGQIISMGTLFVKIPEYCVVSLQLGNHLGYASENICCYPKYIENEKGRSLPILPNFLYIFIITLEKNYFL